MKTVIETNNIYICDICQSKYNHALDAQQCENLPIQSEEPMKVGESIRYEEENQMISRWSYASAEAQILEVILMPNKDKTKHLYIYRVQPKYGSIRWVIPRIEGGYTSPVEWIE